MPARRSEPWSLDSRHLPESRYRFLSGSFHHQLPTLYFSPLSPSPVQDFSQGQLFLQVLIANCGPSAIPPESHRVRCGKLNCERGPAARLTGHFNLSLVFLNNRLCHSKPKSEARLFGRKVRLKNLSKRLFGYSNTGVCYLNRNITVVLLNPCRKESAGGHSLKRVYCDIRKTRFKPFAIAENHRRKSLNIKCHFNSLFVRLRFNKRDRILNELSQIYILHCQSGRATVVEKIVDEAL